jgi:hypothetical protein
MEKKIIDPTTVPGWGIDADPQDKPNYPIKHYTGDDHQRKNWQRPTLQPAKVEILKSTERPYLSAVFGTANPPKGLSGALRRFAFKYSENMNRHWLMLIMADRVDSFESILGDIFRFRFPNFIKEHGGRALWKYKPMALIGKLLIRFIVVAAIVTLIVYLVKRNQYHD